MRVAANGELIVGLAASSVLFSVDGGVTWRWSDRYFSNTAIGVSGNGTRFLVYGEGSTAIWLSSGNGLGPGVVV